MVYISHDAYDMVAGGQFSDSQVGADEALDSSY
jgi:hypothetical protein